MMDGLTLMAAVFELQSAVNQRIEKVIAPDADEIHLILKNGERILISASPENCRIHFSTIKKANPLQAPMFCMLLRKWLTGGSITAITQINGDRIVELSIEKQNELFETNRSTLIVEIMGRHSNIILVDENRTILDSIKRVGLNVSSARTIIPSIAYQPPPTAKKLDPRKSAKEDFFNALTINGKLGQVLSSHFYGFAPDMAYALCESFNITDAQRAEDLDGLQRERLSNALFDFFSQTGANGFLSHMLIDANGTPLKLFPFRPKMPQEFLLEIKSISHAIDELYANRDVLARMRRLSSGLVASLKHAISRREKKLLLYDEAIASQNSFKQHKTEGEAILANLYRLNRTQSEFTATIYDEEGQHELLIQLDPKLSPAGNAQKRFKQYQKAKSALNMALDMRKSVQTELEYLRSQLDYAQRARTPQDLYEIRDELTRLKYIKAPTPKHGKPRNKQKKPPESSPLKFLTEDGHEILIGKNSLQNERVTFKLAAPDDIWLHVRGMPGSHVILKLKDAESDPAPLTLAEAAQLAAYYSSARMSDNVPVDYTRRKRVKKHPSGMPGMVNYTEQKTLFVTPKEIS